MPDVAGLERDDRGVAFRERGPRSSSPHRAAVAAATSPSAGSRVSRRASAADARREVVRCSMRPSRARVANATVLAAPRAACTAGRGRDRSASATRIPFTIRALRARTAPRARLPAKSARRWRPSARHGPGACGARSV